MKILTNKKYEELMQTITDLQMEYASSKHDNSTYYEQVEYLRKANNKLADKCSLFEQLSNDCVKYDCEIKELKKEIRNLKSLLTKNGIEYKKEKKNGKPRN